MLLFSLPSTSFGPNLGASAALLVRSLDDDGMKGPADEATRAEEDGDEGGIHAGAATEEVVVLGHGFEAAEGFEDGNNIGKLLKGRDVDVGCEEGDDDNGEAEDEGGGVDGGVGCDEEEDREGEGKVVEDNDEGDPEEGAEKMGEHVADCGEGGAKGDGLGSVEGCDREDDNGSGEEGEGEKEEEEDKLVKEKKAPLTRGGRRGLEVAEDGVGEEGEGEDGQRRGERRG